MFFVLLQKNGDCITKKAKELTIPSFYKKCGFRSENDFKRNHIWSVKLDKNASYLIAVYGKTKGRSGQENKYELPPPLDTTLFYGNIGLLSMTPEGEIQNFTKEEWYKVYNTLYGGFENLSDTKDKDEQEYVDSEDDEANYDSSMLTKSGYLKDNFVVSDESDTEKKKTRKQKKKEKYTKVPEREEEEEEEEYQDDNDDDNDGDGDEDDDDDEPDHEQDHELYNDYMDHSVHASEPEPEPETNAIFEDEYTDSELSEEEFTDDDNDD